MPGSNVLEYVIDFNAKPAQEKLTDLKSGLDTVGESVKALSEQKYNDATGEVNVLGLDNKDTIESTLSNASRSIEQYSKSFTKMGKGMQEILLAPFSLMASQVDQLDKTLTGFTKKHLSTQDYRRYNNTAAAQAAAIAESKAYSDAALGALNNPILTHKKMDSNLPYLRGLAETIIGEDSARNRNSMSLNSGAAFVGRSKVFRDAIKDITGITYQDDDERYYQAARALLASSTEARSRFTGSSDYLKQFKFDNKAIYSNNIDKLPLNMQEAYLNRGVIQGKTSRGRKIHANEDVYQKLIDLADYGENHTLVDLASQVGLMNISQYSGKGKRSKTGTMLWRQQATMDQFDTLAGLALKGLNETRYGSPLYPRSPIDNKSNSTTIRELNAILEVLGQEPQLSPGILSEKNISHFGEYVQKNKDAQRATIRSFKQPSLYVIPQTGVDSQGVLSYSDPKTAARTSERTRKGFGDREEDTFVAVNDSLFTRLAGFSPKDHNTFGYGADQYGQAIYGAPKVIKLKADNLIPHDEFGMPIPTTKGQKTQPTKEMLAFTDIMENGGMYGEGDQRQRYVFGWTAAQGKGAYLIPAERKEAIRKQFEEEWFMPSPLEGFNSEGVIVPGDREKTNKQINNLRKGASPGTPLTDYGFRLPTIKTVDYEALDSFYETMGLGKVARNQIIDGLAFGSPDYIPTSLQGRLWGPAGKFMLQRTSLADLYGKSGAFSADMAYDGNKNLNQLITRSKNKYGYSLWVPSIAMRNLEENPALLEELNATSVQDVLTKLRRGKYSPKQAEEIRSTWMTDIMSNPDVMATDQSVKNRDQFRVLPEKMYRGFFGLKDTDIIPDSRRDSHGRILLTNPESEKYMYEASRRTHGVWAMKANDDFDVSKDTISVSAADAINYPPSLIRESNRLYDAKLARFADKGWLRGHFLENPQYAAKVENDEKWIDSQEAQAIIQEEKKSIIADRDLEHRYLIKQQSSNVLAQMFPGSGNDRAIKALGGGEINPNSEVAPLFPELFTEENLTRFFDAKQLYDEVGELRKEYFIEKNGQRILDPTKFMFAPGFNHRTAVGGRMPASPGTYQELINLAFQDENKNGNLFMKAFKAVGNYDMDTAFVTPEGIQRMNTGDFDGDTIWLYAQLADDMISNLKKINVPMDKAKAKAARIKEESDKITEAKKLPNINTKYYGDNAVEDSKGQARTSAILNQQGAQLIMGQATAGIRNILSYGDLNDPNTAEALQALVDYYDLGTSEVMNMGLEPQIKNDLAKKFMMSGRTYNRLMQQIGQEESTGEPRIDSIFKYRTGSPTSARDLAVVEMNAIGRRTYGSDQGLRERLLRAVDRRYTSGTALHSAADVVGNIIADTESGYRFWSTEEVEKELSGLKAKIIEEARGDQDQIKEADNLQNFINEFKRTGLSLDRLQTMASESGPMADQAKFLLSHTATDGEKSIQDQISNMIEARRTAAREVADLQAQKEGLSDIDLSRLGEIQDTRYLNKFKTSWTVTSVEPFMDGERTKARLIPFLSKGKVYDLTNGSTLLRGVPISDINKLDFGSYEAMAKKERDELLNKPVDTIDTLLGTFMHAGFEEFFTNNAPKIAAGQMKAEDFAGFTQRYRDMLNEATTDSNGNATTWRKLFDNVGVNIDDITKAFTEVDEAGNAKFGPTIEALKKSESYKRKLENIFGIEYIPSEDGKIRVSMGRGRPEQLLLSYFDELAPADQRMKRVVATENKIYDENGKATDISGYADVLPIELPAIFGDRYVHAKPDLVYEGFDNKYHIMDYKSGSIGAAQAMYQNAIYVRMLEKLGTAAHTGYYDDGTAVSAGLLKNLEPYKQFVDEITDENGNKKYISKFEGGTIQSFDLSSGRKNVINASAEGINDVFEEYRRGIQNKAQKLKEGYVEGKMLMQDLGEIQSFKSITPQELDKQIQAVEERALIGSDLLENTARRQFLVEQFKREQDQISEARGDISKYKKQYGLAFNNPSINKFGSLTRLFDEGLSQDMMAALYAEYNGSPEIQRIIADQMAGKANAKEDLSEIMRAAAVQDSIFARDRLTGMVLGKDSNSSALSAMDVIDKEVAIARGSLENMKDEQSWANGKWRTKAEKKDLSLFDRTTKQGNEDYEAAVEYNIKEEARATHAAQNELSYIKGKTNFDNLLIAAADLKQRAFDNESKHEQSNLETLLKNGDPYSNLAEAINKREQDFSDFILEKQMKIEQLQKRLDEKDTNNVDKLRGADRLNTENLVKTLQSSVSRAKEAMSGASDQVVQSELEKLGLDNKTVKERSKEWLDRRRAAVLQQFSISNTPEGAAYNEAINNWRNLESEDDESMEVQNAARQVEAAKQAKEERERELTRLKNSKLESLRNLGEDIEKDFTATDNLNLRRADILSSGGGFTREERIQQLASQRFAEVLKIGQALPSEEQDAYWASHRYDTILSQVRNELDKSDAIAKMQREASVASVQERNALALSQSQYGYDQFWRQQRQRYSTSRIGNALYGLSNSRRAEEQKLEGLQTRRDEQERAWNIFRQALKDYITTTGKTGKQLEEEKDTKYMDYLAQAKKDKSNLVTTNKQINQSTEQINKLSSAGAQAQAVFGSLGQTLNTTFARFGRQLFMKAINEVKQFTQQYDKSMTSIQMITQKSDEEVNKLGKSLIQTALNSGATVSETTSAAENLYRQGLSDEEVETRLTDVIKFSKVSGISTNEASKIITTAMQNGLASTSAEAMDPLVALGDTAATTAAEISKGIQKSAAAVKQSGLSYDELITLLTIGTSKTQLGGSTIGSTLNTLMYRLYKVNNGEDFYDENGNHVASTAASKALSQMGVSLYDENGNFRGPYQILMDLAENWEEADDTAQSMILSTLGAGRQRSNVATLLQGLAADNGEIAGKYLATAGNSAGITDQKYDDYLDSLQAKLNGVKTSFDQLIETLGTSDLGKGVMEGISGFFQGLTAFNETSFGGIAAGIGVVTVAVAALSAAIKANPITWAILAGAFAITEMASLIGMISDYNKASSPESIYQSNIERSKTNFQNYTTGASSKINKYQAAIDENTKLYDKYIASKNGNGTFTESDRKKFDENYSILAGSFDSVAAAAGGAQNALENWSSVLAASQTAVSDFRTATDETAKYLSASLHRDINKEGKEAVAEIEGEYPVIKGKQGKRELASTEAFMNRWAANLYTESGDLNIEDALSYVGDNTYVKPLIEYIANRKKEAFIDESGNIKNDKNSWIDILTNNLGVFEDVSDFEDYIENGEIKWNALAAKFYDWALSNSSDFEFENSKPFDFKERTSQTTWLSSQKFNANKHLKPYSGLVGWMLDNNLNGVDIGEEEKNKILQYYSDSESFKEDLNDNFSGLLSLTGSQYETHDILYTLYQAAIQEALKGNEGLYGKAVAERNERLQKVYNDVLAQHSELSVSGYQGISNEKLGDIVTQNIINKHNGEVGKWVFDEDVAGQTYEEIESYLANPAQYLVESGAEIPQELQAQAAEYSALKAIQNMPDIPEKQAEYAKLKKYYSDLYGAKETKMGFSDILSEGITKFEESNSAKVQAENLYNAIQNQGITGLEGFIGAVNGENIKNFQSVLDTNSPIANQIRQYMEEKNGEWVLKEGIDADTAWTSILQSISSAGLTGSEYLSRAENAKLASNFANGQGLNDTNAMAAAKSVYGEQLYNMIREAGGVEGLTSDFAKTRATNLAANYAAGISGLTSLQKYDEIQKVFNAINAGELSELVGSENSEAMAIVADAMSGFSNWNEYAALKTKQEAGTLTNKDEIKQLAEYEKELELFKQDTQIEFEIRGLSTLEQAGKLLEGTASNVEKLKKGGQIALDLIVSMSGKAYEQGQQTAMLYEGNASQKDKAAMAILGMGETQYYADREGNLLKAQKYEKSNRQERARSLWEEYASIEDKELRDQFYEDVVRAEGYDFGNGSDFADYLENEGYIVDRLNGTVMDKGHNYITDLSERLRMSNGFMYTGASLKSATASSFLSKSRNEAESNNLMPAWQALAAAAPKDLSTTTSIDTLLKNANIDSDLLFGENGDDMLKAMVSYGARGDEILAYAMRMAAGQKGSFSENYGFALTDLLGKGWRTGNIDIETLRNNYKTLRSDASKWPVIENMISKMENGEEILKVASGDLKGEEAEQAVLSYIGKSLFSDAFEGYNRKDEMTQAAIALRYGEAKDIAGVGSNYYAQAFNLQQAQNAITGANNATNRGYIASLLGLDEGLVKQMMKTESGQGALQKMIDESSSDFVEEYAAVLSKAFNVDIKATSYNDLINKIKSAASGLEGTVKDSLLAAAEALESGAATASTSTNFGAALEEAAETYAEDSNTQRVLQFLSENFDEATRPRNMYEIQPKRESFYDESVGGNIDLNNRPVVARENGYISTVESHGFLDINPESDTYGKYVLASTVSDEGTMYTDTESEQNYYETGKRLGVFKSQEEMDAYAQKLHEDQEELYTSDTGNPKIELLRRALDYVAGLSVMDRYTGLLTGDENFDLQKFFSDPNTIVGQALNWSSSEESANSPYANAQWLGNIIQAEQTGIKDTSYRSSLGAGIFNTKDQQFIDSSGHFNITEDNAEAFVNRYDELQASQEGGDKLVEEATGNYENFNKVLQAARDVANKVTGSTKNLKNATSDLNDEVDTSKTNDVEKYGNAYKNAASKMASAQSKMNGTVDVLTAISKLRGKSAKNGSGTYKDVLVDAINSAGGNVKKSDFDTMSDKVWNALLDNLEQSAQSDFESGFQDMLRGAFNDINTAIDNGEITYEQVVDVVTKVNNSGDMSGFTSLLESIKSQYAATAESYAGNLLTYFISISEQLNADSGEVSVDADTSANASKGKAKPKTELNNKGGGGGGGDSAAQDAIDEAEHAEKEAQHRINLIQTHQGHYQRQNDYTNYANSIEEEVQAQQYLQSTLQSNIDSLRTQMDATEEGSDDWYSLRDAIMEAEEEMEEISNTIDDLNKKKVEMKLTIQQNAENAFNSASNLYDYQANKYQAKGNYAAYEVAMANKLGLDLDTLKNKTGKSNDSIYEKQKKMYEAYAEDYKNMMNSFEEGSESYIEARDAYNDAIEKAAEAEYNQISGEIELRKARSQQILQDAQDAAAGEAHAVNILSTYGSMYKEGGDYVNYRRALTGEQKYNNEQMKVYASAIDQQNEWATTVRKKFGSDSEEYKTAIETLRTLEETYASLGATVISTDREIQQSRIDEIGERWDYLLARLENQKQSLANIAEVVKQYGSDEDYENALSNRVISSESRLYNLNEEYKKYLSLYNNVDSDGNYLISDNETREALADKLDELAQTIQSEVSDYMEIAAELRSLSFTNAKENFEEKDTIMQHDVKQAQYLESYYQTENMLTMYGKAMDQEKTLTDNRKQNIDKYIDQLMEMRDSAQKANDTELYKKIDQEIQKQQESSLQLTQQMSKLEDQIKKNKEAIRQTTVAIEDELIKEVKARVAKNKEILSSEVSLQKNILDAIKEAYNEQWNIIKKDIDKKKQALNEEKALITERLNFRKKMSSQEDKEEELAEYKSQLAVISADQSRTKDVKELQRKIEDLEEELAWQEAEDQANAQIETITDTIDAYSDYVTQKTEDLNERLKDHNNFATEIVQYMKSFDEFAEFMSSTNAYKYGTAEEREQMETSWRDTWDKYTNTNLDQQYLEEAKAAGAMNSLSAFIEYMKTNASSGTTSRDYSAVGTTWYNAQSTSEQDSLIYKWTELFEKYQKSTMDLGNIYEAAGIDTEEEKHYTTVEANMSTIIDTLGKANTGIDALDSTVKTIANMYKTFFPDYVSEIRDNDYEYEKSLEQLYAMEEDYQIATGHKISSNKYDFNTEDDMNEYEDASSYKPVINAGIGYTATVTYKDADDKIQTKTGSGAGTTAEKAKAAALAAAKEFLTDDEKDTISKIKYTKVYKQGGMVDYTGPAWVDGTKTKPEAFLDAEDTANIKAMTEALSYVTVPTGFVPNMADFGSYNNTVGDIIITINQADLSSDANLDELARSIGRKFTKEISKSGLSLAGYNF